MADRPHTVHKPRPFHPRPSTHAHPRPSAHTYPLTPIHPRPSIHIALPLRIAASRWAKRALGQQSKNPTLRQAVAEQLARGEELRKKLMDSDAQAGSDSELSDSEESEEEESEEGSHEEGEHRRRRRKPISASGQLGTLRKEGGGEMPEKGVLSMGFIRRAVERQRAEAGVVLMQLQQDAIEVEARAQEAREASEAEQGEEEKEVEGRNTKAASAQKMSAKKRRRAARMAATDAEDVASVEDDERDDVERIRRLDAHAASVAAKSSSAQQLRKDSGGGRKVLGPEEAVSRHPAKSARSGIPTSGDSTTGGEPGLRGTVGACCVDSAVTISAVLPQASTADDDAAADNNDDAAADNDDAAAAEAHDCPALTASVRKCKAVKVEGKAEGKAAAKAAAKAEGKAAAKAVGKAEGKAGKRKQWELGAAGLGTSAATASAVSAGYTATAAEDWLTASDAVASGIPALPTNFGLPSSARSHPPRATLATESPLVAAAPTPALQPSKPFMVSGKRRSTGIATVAAATATELEAVAAFDDLVEGGSLLAPSQGQQRLLDEAFPEATEFAADKAAVLDREAPSGAEVAAELPGWGSWGGLGVQVDHRAEERKRTAVEAREQMIREATVRRKDAALRHVIVSEKRDKKAATFTTAGVPFPFKSREQFERSLRAPLGREWNTAASHSSLVAPTKTVTKGAIIDPIAMHRKTAVTLESDRKAVTQKTKGP